jgi:ATP phosphoribosyltransferase regulatory subunit HisZ
MILQVQLKALKLNDTLRHLSSLFVKTDDDKIALVRDRTQELTLRPDDFVEPIIRVIQTKLETPQRYAVECEVMI